MKKRDTRSQGVADLPRIRRTGLLGLASVTPGSGRPGPSHDQFLLRLFVAGATARSSAAVLRIRHLCAAELNHGGKLEVIDIYQQPELARANHIVATPTLVIELPLPVRRLIGRLTSTNRLIVELALGTAQKATL